jgi:hypothetical protein
MTTGAMADEYATAHLRVVLDDPAQRNAHIVEGSWPAPSAADAAVLQQHDGGAKPSQRHRHRSAVRAVELFLPEATMNDDNQWTVRSRWPDLSDIVRVVAVGNDGW